uniref:Ig-like domain-containing protein n=1 Tax=Pundamilia nyererei TaxID=303518 RepID=A0A3B4G6J7_9CICH
RSGMHWLTPSSRLSGPGSGIKVIAPEGSDAILPCSLGTNHNLEQELFDWRKTATNKQQEVFMYDGGIHYNNGLPDQDEHFRGRVSHFSDQLQFGNASVIIRNTKVNDSGVYTCDFPRLQPQQTFSIKLVVAEALKPHITILGATESGVQLKCDVGDVHPKPKLQWEDSDGNVLPADDPVVSERGGRYNVTLCTTVTPTKTNCFHCVVKQEGSYQVIDQEINLSGENLLSVSILHPAVMCWIVSGASLHSLHLGSCLVCSTPASMEIYIHIYVCVFIYV